jgi:outer membrane protein assembly factor BamA
VKRFGLTVALLALLASPGAAQIPGLPELPTFGETWVAVALPKVYWAGADEMGFGLFYAQINQLGFDDWDAPEPYQATVSLDGNITTTGTKRLELALRAPKWVDGWRFYGSLEGRRDARARYFGIGNETTYDKDLETDATPYFYRADFTRWRARGEVQRRIVGGLRVLAGIHAEQWRIDTLSADSKLAQDLAAGVDPTIGRNTGDVSGRIGLVFDTRNDQPAPTRGVLLEAIFSVADSGLAGSLSYTRTTVSATGYLPLIGPLHVAARVLGESLGGSPGIGSYDRIETSERPFRGVGGAESNRAIPQRRLLDADKLLANLDLRYDFFEYPTLVRATAVGFVDAARAFPAGEWKLTTSELAVGGGLGLFLQFGRAGILGTTAGLGPDGVIWNFHTWWPF